MDLRCVYRKVTVSACYSVFAIREYRMPQASLRPQDVFVLAKLLSYQGRRPPIALMSAEISVSSSEIHAALKRLVFAGLVSNDANENRPLLAAVEEFLVHGVKYAFPVKPGELTRGVPTSYAAPPLDQMIDPGAEPPPVWPWPEGHQRGVSLEPLHKNAPAAALRDPLLYEMLALIDALREGRARERKLAEQELIARLRRSA
jgi:hypothetical protein